MPVATMVLNSPSEAESFSLPRDTYLTLDALMQSFRRRVLSQAADERGVITRKGILQALRAVVESLGNDESQRGRPHREILPPSPEIYDFLERRLSNLRLYIIRLACSSQMSVQPDKVKLCYEHVMSKPDLLRGLLDVGTESPLPVAAS